MNHLKNGYKNQRNIIFRHRDYNNKTVVIGSVIFWVLVIIVIVITVAVLYLKIDPRDLGRANKTVTLAMRSFPYVFKC